VQSTVWPTLSSLYSLLKNRIPVIPKNDSFVAFSGSCSNSWSFFLSKHNWLTNHWHFSPRKSNFWCIDFAKIKHSLLGNRISYVQIGQKTNKTLKNNTRPRQDSNLESFAANIAIATVGEHVNHCATRSIRWLLGHSPSLLTAGPAGTRIFEADDNRRLSCLPGVGAKLWVGNYTGYVPRDFMLQRIDMLAH
jgi:hypothetical protein